MHNKLTSWPERDNHVGEKKRFQHVLVDQSKTGNNNAKYLLNKIDMQKYEGKLSFPLYMDVLFYLLEYLLPFNAFLIEITGLFYFRAKFFKDQVFISTYYIQQCFSCRPSDSTVPTDVGIEPRTVATGALAAYLLSNKYKGKQ
jgi:hypothetical protein